MIRLNVIKLTNNNVYTVTRGGGGGGGGEQKRMNMWRKKRVQKHMSERDVYFSGWRDVSE